MTDSELGTRIAAIRQFNRFYTQRIGVLQDGWLHSPFSLAEARVLYELTQREKATASELIDQLGLDAGYLSRILRRFQQQGLIRKETSRDDGRRSHLSLTAKGRKAFAPLEAHTIEEVSGMLAALAPDIQQEVLAAMRSPSKNALNGQQDKNYILREPRPGDFGWVVARHATFYAENYGWREPFEGMCAQIVADFANKNDTQRERCWIAERNGQNVGSIFRGEGNRRCRAHAAVAGRSVGTGSRHRRCPVGFLHRLRAPGGLSPDDAVDASDPDGRAHALSDARASR